MLRQLKLITGATLLALSTCALQAQTPAQGNTGNATLDHPGWVHIPGELINPMCVHEIPNGARVEVNESGQMSGDVTLKGALFAHFAACPDAPVVTRQQGSAPNLTAPVPNPANGWVESSAWNVSLAPTDNIDYLSGTWTVPSGPCDVIASDATPNCVGVVPNTEDNAVIYLFNGIQPSTQTWILQSVLQLGDNGMFGGNYWVLASWIVGPDFAFYGRPQIVYTGNSITGTVQMLGVNTNNGTLYWQVTATDTSTSATSTIQGSTAGLHWTWAYAGVLEVHDLTSCEEYPSTGHTTFSDTVVDHGFSFFTPITPQEWGDVSYTPGGPSCSYSVTAGSPSTLHY
jgi:hypothetical protein